MVALWSIYAIELVGLVVLGVQRSVADRRGGQAWVIRGLEPAIERAMDHGERRQQHDARLPLPEPESRQRLQNLALTASALLSPPTNSTAFVLHSAAIPIPRINHASTTTATCCAWARA